MSSSSSNKWKQYGGQNTFENIRQINTGSIITENIIIKNALNGDLKVNGNITTRNIETLTVNATNEITTNDLFVNGNQTVSQNSTFNGNVMLNGNTFVNGTINFNNNLDTLGNLSVAGNLFVNKDSYLYGNIFLNNNALYITPTGLGLNNDTPNATLDISGDNTQSFKVFSNQPITYNTVLQNNTNQGIILYGDTDKNSIQFYNDNPLTSYPTSDANITYLKGGTLELNTTDNTIISSKLTIKSNHPNQTINHTPLGESALVYDTNNGVYLPYIYNNSTEMNGSALTLLANDSSSCTFLHIKTPEPHYGLSIGGGVYPKDQTRAMGTFGFTDPTTNTFFASQTVVSGTSIIHNKTTTGINNYQPNTDNYALDINGETRITNGDLQYITAPFCIYSIAKFPNSNGLLNVLAVGSFIVVDESYPNKHYVYKSIDSGKTWVLKTLSALGDIDRTTNVFNSIFYYNELIAFIVGKNGFYAYTNNGGDTWYKFNLTINNSAISNNATAIYAYTLSVNTIRCFISYFDTYAYYFDVLTANIMNGTFGTVPISLTSTNISTSISGVVSMSANSTNLFLLTPTALFSVPINSPQSSHIDMTNNTGLTITNGKSLLSNNETFLTLACSNGIYSSQDSGTTFNFSPTTSPINVFSIYSTTQYVASGESGVLYYTSNGGTQWNAMPNDIANASGTLGSLINNTYNNINSAIFTDQNTMLFNGVLNNDILQSNLYYLYCPNLFNSTNHNTLDVSGSIRVSGSININDGGFLNSNNSTFNLLNTSNNITIGNNNTNIYIGNTAGGTGNVILNNDTTFIGNMIATKIINSINTTNSTALNTGSMILSGGASISKDLYIGGNINVAGTNIDTYNNGISIFNTPATLSIGNIAGQGTTTVNNNTVFSKDVLIIGNLTLTNSATVTVDSSNSGINTFTNPTNSYDLRTGSIIIYGGTSIDGNLYVGGSTNLLSSLSVNNNIITNGNIGVGKSNPAFSVDVNGIINANALYVNGSPYIGSQWVTQGNNINYNVNNVGKVGINTTSPNFMLDVSGNINARENLLITTNNSNNTANNALTLVDSSLTRMDVFPSLQQGNYNSLVQTGDTAIIWKTNAGGNTNTTSGFVIAPANTTINSGGIRINNTTTTIKGNVIISGNKMELGYNDISYNVGVGKSTLNSLTTGSNNSSFGGNSTMSLTTGSNNVAIGKSSLYTLTTGNNNTAVGYQSLYSSVTNSNNTAVGYQSLYGVSTGTNNTAIGYNSYSTGNYSNSTAIGYNTTINANNTIVLGTPTETTYISGNVYVGVSTAPPNINAIVYINGGGTLSANIGNITTTNIPLLVNCSNGLPPYSGNILPLSVEIGTVTNKMSFLKYFYRNTTASNLLSPDSTTSSLRLHTTVDNVPMSYIEYNGSGGIGMYNNNGYGVNINNVDLLTIRGNINVNNSINAYNTSGIYSGVIVDKNKAFDSTFNMSLTNRYYETPANLDLFPTYNVLGFNVGSTQNANNPLTKNGDHQIIFTDDITAPVTSTNTGLVIGPKTTNKEGIRIDGNGRVGISNNSSTYSFSLDVSGSGIQTIGIRGYDSISTIQKSILHITQPTQSLDPYGNSNSSTANFDVYNLTPALNYKYNIKNGLSIGYNSPISSNYCNSTDFLNWSDNDTGGFSFYNINSIKNYTPTLLVFMDASINKVSINKGSDYTENTSYNGALDVSGTGRFIQDCSGLVIKTATRTNAQTNGVRIIFDTDGKTTGSSSFFSSPYTYISAIQDVITNNYTSASLNFATNNATRMTILNSGNVGIGNNNPIYNLDVTGNGRYSTNLYITGNVFANQCMTANTYVLSQGDVTALTYVSTPVYRSAFGNGKINLCTSGSGTYTPVTYSGNAMCADTNYNSGLQVGFNNTGSGETNLINWATTAKYGGFDFNTIGPLNTTIVKLGSLLKNDAGGNILSTLTNTASLNINGPVNSKGFYVNGVLLASNVWNYVSGSTTNIYYNTGTVTIGATTSAPTGNVFGVTGDSSITGSLWITNSSSSSTKNIVLNNYNTPFISSANTVSSKITVLGQDQGGSIEGFNTYGSGGGLIFNTSVLNNADTERMRITSGGDIGIGISTPSYKLHVLGTAAISGTLTLGSGLTASADSYFNGYLNCLNGTITGLNLSSSRDIYIGNNYGLYWYSTGRISYTSTNQQIILTYGSAKTIFQGSDGNVIFYDTTGASKTTILNGDINTLGGCTAVSFNATSDYRIKENTQDLNTNIYNVDNLRPVSYHNKLTNKKDLGLIAHELQEHYPFMVNGEKDGENNQSVNYTTIIPILIKEIQQLKEKNTQLNNEINWNRIFIFVSIILSLISINSNITQ